GDRRGMGEGWGGQGPGPGWGGKRREKTPPDRGKWGARRGLRVEPHGLPGGWARGGANRHDKKLVEATLRSIPIERPQPTAEQPQGLCLDKGYDYEDTRQLVQEFGFTAHVRSRGEEAKALAREAGHRARRWVAARTHHEMDAS